MTALRRRGALLLLFVAALLNAGVPGNGATSSVGKSQEPAKTSSAPATLARHASGDLQERLRRGQCEGKFPLPLASHWTPDGRRYPHSTTPDWQMEQIERGHHWLLTLEMGKFGDPWDEWAESYYRAAIENARRRRLPIALVGTQWERILYEEAPWRDLPPEKSALVLEKGDRLVPKVSPFGAVEPWAEAGSAWAETPIVAKFRELYPDPPYVVVLSNNESEKLEPLQIEESLRYLKLHGSGTSGDAQRRALGDGYIQRFRALVEGMRANLGTWTDRSIIIGWGGTNSRFGSGHRWMWWNLPNSGVPVPGRLNIAPFSWDGISARYYVVNLGRHKGEDYTLESPNVEVMQVPLEAEFACKHNSDYYWEISTWFDPVFVDRIERQVPVPPVQRYEGAVKWAMWIARPRVVREFSYGKQSLSEFEAYLRATMKAVDEVHADSDLSSFWRSSDLVPNPAREHPYDKEIPPEYRDVKRWMALETNLDPRGPWLPGQEVRVWALARVQGEPGSRRWLVYAQSPRGARDGVRVKVPEQGEIRIRALPEGCYYVVQEADGAVRAVGLNRSACSLDTQPS